jgi:AraC family transcriptional regulator of adaptative response/methylated-DNA-[protein]-cysteine methyltransferase
MVGSTAKTGKDKIAESITHDPRWAKLVARDREADFFYSVKSTGVYCRPSCAARMARPENVRFHQSCSDAEQAGFRPCKRCKPNQRSLQENLSAKIAGVCRLIERSEHVPALKQLAGHAGLSLFHFHRAFKAATGLTPRQYAAAHRAKRVRATLKRSKSVTNAIYDAGFNSSGRFYEAANTVLGMTPTSYRDGGKNNDILFAVGECSLGSILVARSQRGICSILMGDDPRILVQDLQRKFPNATLIGNDSQFEELVAKVVGLVEAPGVGIDLPLDIRGTAFQQRVWSALLQIPAGSTMTYSEIAHHMGMPTAVRAVAQACASNSIAVAIPCHRVIRSDGALSGYRWGVERKQALLGREARA